MNIHNPLAAGGPQCGDSLPPRLPQRLSEEDIIEGFVPRRDDISMIQDHRDDHLPLCLDLCLHKKLDALLAETICSEHATNSSIAGPEDDIRSDQIKVATRFPAMSRRRFEQGASGEVIRVTGFDTPCPCSRIDTIPDLCLREFSDSRPQRCCDLKME